MPSGFIVRLRPIGPWRLGPSSGARDRVDRVLHSDTLYSALTIAADSLGFLAEWLGATAQAPEPVVRVGSAFPFAGRTLLAPAPKHVWPPSGSSRVRWKAARFVPLHVVPRLLAYEALKEERWAVDPVSEAVLPVEKFGEVTPPFRVAMRWTAAVDRLSRASAEAGSTACLEFAENAGMWCPVLCPDNWRERVQALFRFIADAGIGGERSSGWGRASAPEFEALHPVLATGSLDEVPEQHAAGYWLLSLYSPAASDRVDWSRGSYAMLRRSGRTHGAGVAKVESAMAEEGSILVAESAPAGMAHDVAPPDSGHPVYRAGFAFAVPVAIRLPGFQALERTTAEASSTPAAAEPEPPLQDIGEAPVASATDTGETEPVTASDEPVQALGEALLADATERLEPEPIVAETEPAATSDELRTEPLHDIGEALLASATDTSEPEPFVAETERPPDEVPENSADGGAVEDAAAKTDAGDSPNEANSEEPR